MARMLPLLLAVTLLALVHSANSAASGDTKEKPRLRGPVQEMCEEFLGVSDYVVAHCKSVPSYATIDAYCLQSFQLFYESPALLIECETLAETRHAKSRMTQFMEIYSKWQQHHTCELFHTKEQRAAQQCGGAAVQKPWHETQYPLYCEEIFRLYQANRRDLDAVCERTDFSDAFWEAYADYVATPLCKTYYSHVRSATSHGCASATKATRECDEMFHWYTQQRPLVERECLEVQGAKPFYKGFYAWKRHQK